ncbi:L-erythro-3,5-diaminohexanoate dehydrogenase [Pseudothermotoga lettingae]|uniref:Alcohol dehydrogenase zinc-binding domain protein n=1 Tax=Pseudothermotoga lettingae (strain ATCC BAA-301 / DSM 14385 / NBRC 107922 / TMO) TaxID=416591 RepID=A8F7T4_PSELT|nr:zinc-binding dehydrogenase [Pseudothermotoga lettingae]ABV34218.1 Alcohol dehydrogenase zinc-binding domain protein [Pseudothermotoga lettingae TMO]MDI3494489.1 L-erythro-3,5-diaminohexanoate dehydrogenase [Pseudothermotoga sp.]GLI48838.1 L-erythro-3,5-diaminohexanoate dehydrogenase [Pseudothermotoga lettingae TMO]
MRGDPFGLHRVIEPKGKLPQPAWKIDNDTSKIYDNEILIDVIKLNIDAASFTQIKNEAGKDESKVAEKIMQIVKERGKMHNPITGSGGMLIGKIKKIGKDLKIDANEGDKIATLVSLSLTPLNLKKITKVHLDKEQVDVEAEAILFETGVFAKLPEDMPESVALAILDVAGAPIQTARLVSPGDTVLVTGAAGKSGVLCCYVAKKYAGPTGKVIGLVHSEKSVAELKNLKIVDRVMVSDAQDAVGTYKKFMEMNGGELADVVINVVNVPDTEMASVMCCKERGKVYFFSMATSFTKAALGAEGIGKDVDMIIGNGYAKDHAKFALEIVRENKKLYELFLKRYG